MHNLSEPFFISDGVEGVIDGTIIAEIYDGDVMMWVKLIWSYLNMGLILQNVLN